MKKYKVNKGFITQKLGKRTVIFDGEKSVLYTFNETASYIFSKLKLKWDRKRILDSLVKNYNVKIDKAEKDFYQLLADLEANKIISSD